LNVGYGNGRRPGLDPQDPAHSIAFGFFDELRLAAGPFLEREQHTLLEHLLDAHRDELILGARTQRDPVALDDDAETPECPAAARDRCGTLRRIPQRIATV